MNTANQLNPVRRELDHYVIQVRDLDASGTSYERLGFHVLPKMRHIEIGSANRVVQFQHTYLELLGDLDLAKPVVGDNLAERWRCGEGLAMVSLNSVDIDSDHAWVKNLSLNPAPIISARRKVSMPNGTEDETDSVCFYIFRPARKYLSLFLSQHRKPQVIWIPEYQQHPNTAVETTGITWVSDDPTLDRDYFTQLYGVAPELEEAGLIRWRGSRNDTAEIYSRERLAERYPNVAVAACDQLPGYPAGLQISVRDMARLRSILDENKVDYVTAPETVTIAPEQAHGVVIEFIALKT